MVDGTSELSRMRWRCRRGMRELDVLLERWLDVRWPDATSAERHAFDRLLDSEDDLLWEWCTGRSRPADRQLEAILEQVLAPGSRADG